MRQVEAYCAGLQYIPEFKYSCQIRALASLACYHPAVLEQFPSETLQSTALTIVCVAAHLL